MSWNGVMSDDPARDAERYMKYLEKREARRPRCHCCKAVITDYSALHYTIRDFDFWLCLDCVDDKTEVVEA